MPVERSLGMACLAGLLCAAPTWSGEPVAPERTEAPVTMIILDADTTPADVMQIIALPDPADLPPAQGPRSGGGNPRAGDRGDNAPTVAETGRERGQGVAEAARQQATEVARGLQDTAREAREDRGPPARPERPVDRGPPEGSGRPERANPN